MVLAPWGCLCTPLYCWKYWAPVFFFLMQCNTAWRRLWNRTGEIWKRKMWYNKFCDGIFRPMGIFLGFAVRAFWHAHSPCARAVCAGTLLQAPSLQEKQTTPHRTAPHHTTPNGIASHHTTFHCAT